MKRRTILISLLAVWGISATAQTLPYQDPNLPAAERADDLLKRLTIEEKAKLMMDRSPAIERLGIPRFEWWNEALHGIGRNGFATVFPITMGMAASWNEDLLLNVFTAVSDEARAKNQVAKKNNEMARYRGLSYWTPNINIFRDPRWGRGQETYGEDPYLTTRMGLAVVNGLQGPRNTKYRKLLACAKHFAVHSGPEWNRHSFNIEDLPQRDLWETYMPAFKALVQEGQVAEVMCAYQRIDGEPCCGNHRYEQQILRDEWGFKGLITSDCGAVNDFWQPGKHGVSVNSTQATGKAVRAGTDVECGSNYNNLPQAVKNNDVTIEEVDRSLRRLLIARFELGDFDPDELVEWTNIPESIIASRAHKQLALEMAHQSVVLLQNNNGALPLNAQNKKIVVMGPNANDSVMMWGNYSGYPTATVTILQGIRQYLPGARYIAGCGLTRAEVAESRFGHIAAGKGRKGMKATYWNNTDMKGKPAATAIIAEPINQSNGGATVFAPGVNLTDFSARYEGTFVPAETEKLTLALGADDKARVIVNGDTVINEWKSRQRINYKNHEITFEKGKSYNIVVEYVQEDNMAALQFDLINKATPTDRQILDEVAGAETVIFVGGISPRLEGEEMKVNEPGFRGGDRTDIELPKVQRDMLAMLKRAGKRVVFVNCSGGAVGLVPEMSSCDAIVQAWYGGEQGGKAVADVLFGAYNPSGKLPVTFYKNTAQLPDFEDYRMAGRTYRYFSGTPAFPFGHGLSYTTFSYGTPVYNAAKEELTVELANTGKTDGTEIVQVYFKRNADTDGPIKTLCAHKRVSLKAGQKQTVSISLPRHSLEGWDDRHNTMRVVPGQYTIMVGGSSADSELKCTVTTIKELVN